MDAGPGLCGFMIAIELEIRRPESRFDPCRVTVAIDQEPRGKPDIDLSHLRLLAECSLASPPVL
jgi:hypothetical protein